MSPPAKNHYLCSEPVRQRENQFYNRESQVGDRNELLLELLASARRRRLAQIALDELCGAVTLAMCGFTALLIVGTQILDWYWPAGLFAAGMAMGVWRGRKRAPSGYRLLQAIDRRLHLADALSTAYFFRKRREQRQVAEEVRNAQAQEAEALCRQVSAKRAVPWQFPRRAYAVVLAVAVAGTLFGVRYGVRNSLDLGPPITASLFEFYRPTTLANLEGAAESTERDLESALAEPEGAGQQERRRSEVATEAEPERSEALEGEAGADPLRDGDQLSSAERNTADEGAYGEKSDSGGQQGGGEAPPDASLGDAESQSASSSPPAPPASDLLSKLQDAFANMLAKLNVDIASSQSQGTSEQEGDRQGGPPSGNGDERPQGGESAEQIAGQDPNGEQVAEGAEPNQLGEGQANGRMTEGPGENGGPHGAGVSDGEKDVKLAEQLEAMGELSEILGQRAEDITGEVLIEVVSGDRNLRTAYSEAPARHGGAGGVIHRDEVPLELREYVRSYFEQVHKQTPTEDP